MTTSTVTPPVRRPRPTGAEIDAAVRRAVREAVREHALLGRSVVGAEGDKIVTYTPEETLAYLARTETPVDARQSS